MSIVLEMFIFILRRMKMKKNGNNKKIGDYYAGIDSGSNSCGWAVTDENYNLLRFKGKDMWGARLFNCANDASKRRLE